MEILMRLVWDRVWVYKAPHGALKQTKFNTPASGYPSWALPYHHSQAQRVWQPRWPGPDKGKDVA